MDAVFDVVLNVVLNAVLVMESMDGALDAN